MFGYRGSDLFSEEFEFIDLSRLHTEGAAFTSMSLSGQNKHYVRPMVFNHTDEITGKEFIYLFGGDLNMKGHRKTVSQAKTSLMQLQITWDYNNMPVSAEIIPVPMVDYFTGNPKFH